MSEILDMNRYLLSGFTFTDLIMLIWELDVSELWAAISLERRETIINNDKVSWKLIEILQKHDLFTA